MNLDRYEKIDGREALKRLVDGENIYVDESTFFHLPTYNELLKVEIINGKPTSKEDWVSITEFFEHEWFVKKPFDVRQAMIERPNKWVGAYKGPYGTWYKVGFDGMYMTAIFTELEHKIEATHDTDGVRPIFFDYSRYLSGRDDRTLSVLGSCIPIEDVPEEANQ